MKKTTLLKNNFVFYVFVLLLSGNLFMHHANAQDADKQTQGVVWHGQNASEISLGEIMDRQAYLEKNNMLPHFKNRRVENNEKDFLNQKFNNPNSPKISSYKSDEFTEQTQKVQSSFNIALSFDAVMHSDIDQGWIPPDPMVACGPNQLMVTVNGRMRVFDKRGRMQYDVNEDVFFASVLHGSNAVDPRVRYDATSNRWILSAITIQSANNYIMLAISSSGVLTRQTTFKFASFQQNKVGPSPNIDDNLFADYETLGVDANAVYIGCNMFNSAFHTSVWVVNKTDLINGILTVTAFRNIANGTSGGPYTPQGVSNSDPAATQGYFVGTDFNNTGLLVVRRISNPGGTPSISGNLNITVPTTATPLSVPNKNGCALPAIDARLLLATMQKDNNTGKYTLWCSHSIKVNSGGIGSNTGDRDAVRWYQLSNLTTTPSLLQAGTLFDATAAKNFYWMGTVAMNNNGDALISCSVSSANTGANGSVAVHFSSGVGGSTSGAQNTTNNVASGYCGGRWGDYSSAVIDPADGATLWACHEYIMNGDYVVRIAKVTVTNTPQGISTGQNANANWLARVYPNPALNKLNISISGNVTERLHVSITNLYGEVIAEKDIASDANSFSEDISKLQRGFYFITLSTETNTQSIQFQKK